jgi:hypothetical protein
MELINKEQLHGQPQVPGDRALMGVRSFFGNPIPLFFLNYFFVDPERALRAVRFFFGQSDSYFFQNYFFLSTPGHSDP